MSHERPEGEDRATPQGELKLDPSVVASLYAEHAEELRRFLIGLVRDVNTAHDVLQTTFVKATEVGHTARKESLKGWLFRVAYNEAMLFRRRQGLDAKVLNKVAWNLPSGRPEIEDPLIRLESLEQLEAALQTLPEEQKVVVRKKIYEGKTFARIAEEVGAPLGTVLSRMQLALNRLRKKMGPREED